MTTRHDLSIARPPSAPDAPRVRADLTDDICRELTTCRDEDRRHVLLERLVEANMPVARTVASRYRRRGIADDDLDQVAYLALVKAARRFDPDTGNDFLTYAVPTIRGELRRHFRDSGWVVRPPRRLQELQATVRDAASSLGFELGRDATSGEIATRLDIEPGAVREVQDMGGCFAPSSLDRPVGEGDSTLGDLLPGPDAEWGQMEARTVLGPVVRALSARDRRILSMRFFEDSTQQQIADEIGVNQSQVSRLLTRIYDDLRFGLADPA